MFGNDESHKRAARRRLQRISLAAALVACTTTAAPAIDPPGTPASADAPFDLMPPLPLSIGQLKSSAAPPSRIERSVVKGIRQNPFLMNEVATANEAATANVVARVSGTASDGAPPASPPASPLVSPLVSTEPAPMLLRANPPVLTLRSIAPTDPQTVSEARIAPGNGNEPADKFTNFEMPPAEEGAAPTEPTAPPATSSGRVTFAISDDGVRAKATLGQPANERRETRPAQETGPALGTKHAVEAKRLAEGDASANPRSLTPRLLAAAAPAITLDPTPTVDEPLPEARRGESKGGKPAPSGPVAATGESPLRKFSLGEDRSSTESVLQKQEEPKASREAIAEGPKDEPSEAPVAMLAKPTKPHSSVTDRQPVVIATTTTPVARAPRKPKPGAATPPASPPEAKLVKPSRTLVIDAPASRAVARTSGEEDVAAAKAKTATAEPIRVQSAETRTITPSEPVRRVRLEDREICEAVLVGPHKLLLIGRRDGTTRLAVWSSDQPEPSLYDITVISREAAPAESPLHAVAERLTETIAANYPQCTVEVVPQRDGLNVRGRANSNLSAREIMRLVRRACLKSVHDNLEIR